MLVLITYLSLIISILSGLPLHANVLNVNHTVVIFAFSGLRWDTMEEFSMSGLHKLAKNGIYVKQKVDAFQTESLPSFITMATGNYPETHGIISNNMIDLATKETFDATSKSSTWWKDVNPVWIENQLQGKFSALCYWPTHKINFNESLKVTYSCDDNKYKDPFEELLTRGEIVGNVMPFVERIDQAKKWLNLKEKRPSFIGIYFEEPFLSVLTHGLKSNETQTTMIEIDNLIDSFAQYLSKPGLEDVNFIVTGESGFTELKHGKEIFLEDYCDTSIPFEVIDNGPITTIFTKEYKNQKLLTEKWKTAHKHMKLYNGSKLPDNFHFSYVNRTMPIILVADEQWRIYPKRIVDKKKVMMGFHGKFQSTHALFVSHGPSFVKNFYLEFINNADVYALICQSLGIQPRLNKCNMTTVNQMLSKKDSWIVSIFKKVTKSSLQITIAVIIAILIFFGAIYIMICVMFKTASCCAKNNSLRSIRPNKTMRIIIKKSKNEKKDTQHLLLSDDEEVLSNDSDKEFTSQSN